MKDVGAGHCADEIWVIAPDTSATTPVEAGVFNVKVTVSVVKYEVADESVRAVKAAIVPDVEGVVCML